MTPAFVAYRLIIDDSYLFSFFTEEAPIVRVLPWAIAVAAAYRLARYNVSALNGDDGKYFEGLPAPATGVFWMGMIIWAGGILNPQEAMSMVVTAGLGLILLPIFMVLKRKFFSLKGWGEDKRLDRIQKILLGFLR